MPNAFARVLSGNFEIAGGGLRARAMPEQPCYLFWSTRLVDGEARCVIFYSYIKKVNGERWRSRSRRIICFG